MCDQDTVRRDNIKWNISENAPNFFPKLILRVGQPLIPCPNISNVDPCFYLSQRLNTVRDRLIESGTIAYSPCPTQLPVRNAPSNNFITNAGSSLTDTSVVSSRTLLRLQTQEARLELETWFGDEGVLEVVVNPLVQEGEVGGVDGVVQ
jgi:hypothetical protein